MLLTLVQNSGKFVHIFCKGVGRTTFLRVRWKQL